MSYKRFSDMTAAEAEAFFADYVAAAPARITWLREKTDLALGPSRNALVELWSWFLAWAATGGTEEPAKGLPDWAPPPPADRPPPLRWDDLREPVIADPNPPPLSPATLWVRDAVSYALVEALRTRLPGLGYRLYRDNDRAMYFNRPVVDIAETTFAEYGVPLFNAYEYALRPTNEWEEKAREPAHLAEFYDMIVLQATDAKPRRRRSGRETAATLLGRRGAADLWELVDLRNDAEESADQLVVDINDELAVIGSDAIDAVVADLVAEAMSGVSDVFRMDREVIVLELEPGADIDLAAMRRILDDRISRRIAETAV